MFASMLKVEQMKLYRRPLVWIELALVAVIIAFSFLAFFGAHMTGLLQDESLTAMMTWPQALPFSLQFVTGQTFGALLVTLLVSLVVAQEYAWGTYALWLRQGISRSTVLGAKFLAMLGPVILIVLTALLIGGVMSAIITVALQGSLDFAQVDWVQVVLSVVRTAWSLLPYVAMACLVAVATRSTAWSLGAAIGYALLVEGILTQVSMVIGGVPAKIAMWLPGSMALAVVDINGSIAATSMSVAATGPQYLPPTVAAVGIGAYTLILLGLAFRTFVRQDFTA
jgi:ABC-type transport system involved in multi-copper enzyme maturation permease subunit